MSTVDRNPQILDQLTERIGATLDRIGRDVAPAVEEFGTVVHAPDAAGRTTACPNSATQRRERVRSAARLSRDGGRAAWRSASTA
jgi:hypothetical protein